MTPSGEIEHLHNQLIAAIYGNVTREMPDHGVATWVSANDKPTTGAGSKPVSGDAAEQRLKTEVMQLPSRDRRRLKDLTQNDVRMSTDGYLDDYHQVAYWGCNVHANEAISLTHRMHSPISSENVVPDLQDLQMLFLRVLVALIRLVCDILD